MTSDDGDGGGGGGGGDVGATGKLDGVVNEGSISGTVEGLVLVGRWTDAFFLVQQHGTE